LADEGEWNARVEDHHGLRGGRQLKLVDNGTVFGLCRQKVGWVRIDLALTASQRP
jgi:hypothetical protein